MGVDRPIDITADQRKTVLALLERYLPNTTTWVYGSRANWTSRPQSDLDMVVFATPEQNDRVAELREAFEESDLPFRVDLFVWDTVLEEFRKRIEAEHVVLVDDKQQSPPVSRDSDSTEEADIKKIGDYFTLQRGTTYKSYLLGQPGPVLLGLATIQRNGGFRSDSLRTYGGESPEKLLVRPGELYVSLKDVTQSADLLGAVAKLPSGHTPGRLTQDTVKLKPRYKDIPLDYIYWLLRTPQYRNYCRAHATGTTNLGFPRDDFLAFPVPPTTPVRHRIVKVLTALDDKIELNRWMNETLEAMARALFKSWFVDFEPVRAKMEGRWRPGESLPGLPAYLYDLFPDRLVESGLGEIPEGWEVKALDEIAIFRNGLALQKYRPQEKEEWLPVVKIAQLRSGKADSEEKATAHIPPECIINDGDVIFSWSGSLMVKIWYGGRAALNQHLFKVTSTKFPKWFFLLCVLSHLPDFQTIAAGKATTMGHIKRHHLSEAICAVPDSQLLTAADDFMTPLLEKGISAGIQSRTLVSLRDALLPKLISGRLR